MSGAARVHKGNTKQASRKAVSRKNKPSPPAKSTQQIASPKLHSPLNDPAELLQLQRVIGNRAVRNLVSMKQDQRQSKLDGQPTTTFSDASRKREEDSADKAPMPISHLQAASTPIQRLLSEDAYREKVKQKMMAGGDRSNEAMDDRFDLILTRVGDYHKIDKDDKFELVRALTVVIRLSEMWKKERLNVKNMAKWGNVPLRTEIVGEVKAHAKKARRRLTRSKLGWGAKFAWMMTKEVGLGAKEMAKGYVDLIKSTAKGGVNAVKTLVKGAGKLLKPVAKKTGGLIKKLGKIIGNVAKDILPLSPGHMPTKSMLEISIEEPNDRLKLIIKRVGEYHEKVPKGWPGEQYKSLTVISRLCEEWLKAHKDDKSMVQKGNAVILGNLKKTAWRTAKNLTWGVKPPDKSDPSKFKKFIGDLPKDILPLSPGRMPSKDDLSVNLTNPDNDIKLIMERVGDYHDDKKVPKNRPGSQYGSLTVIRDLCQEWLKVHPAKERDQAQKDNATVIRNLKKTAWRTRKNLEWWGVKPADKKIRHKFKTEEIAFELIAKKIAYRGTAGYEQILQKWGYEPQFRRTIQGKGLTVGLLMPDEKIAKQPKPTPILAFRGTNAPIDLAADMDPIAVGFIAFQHKRKNIGRLIEEAGGRVHTTGHSLGGAMAQYAGVHFPSKIGRVVTFQSASITLSHAAIFSLRKRLKKAVPSVTHHAASGDPVPHGGLAHLEGTTYVHWTKKLLLGAHGVMFFTSPDFKKQREALGLTDDVLTKIDKKALTPRETRHAITKHAGLHPAFWFRLSELGRRALSPFAGTFMLVQYLKGKRGTLSLKDEEIERNAYHKTQRALRGMTSTKKIQKKYVAILKQRKKRFIAKIMGDKGRKKRTMQKPWLAGVKRAVTEALAKQNEGV